MLASLSILERIQPLAGVAGFSEAENFLRFGDTRYHEGGTCHQMTVEAVEHAWGTRLSNAYGKGQVPLPGSEHLVEIISNLSKETVLNYAIFEKDSGVGCFWFIEETGEPVGFVIADTPVVKKSAAS